MSEMPPPCDGEVFERGTPVFRTDTIRSVDLEPWVQRVADRSGQRVDWHWAGGRAIVLALGDLDKVRAALWDLRTEHDELWLAAVVGCGMSVEAQREYLASIWGYAHQGIAATGAEEREKFIVRLA